jgi:mannose-6-phosphate isomerase-like protein (cupin superfamily)
MFQALTPRHIASSLTEHWSPHVIGELDDAYIKVAKVLGTFGWHSHDDEDELFLILEGQLRIEMEQGAVDLAPGDLFVVPMGVRHNPVAAQECLLMLIERKSTLHTGNTVSERTRSIEQQLGTFRSHSVRM